MKAASLTLVIAVAMMQGPIAPQGLQPGQGPAAAQTPPAAPLNAAECKCSIDVTVKRPNGESIDDVDITVTMAPAGLRFQLDVATPQPIPPPLATAGSTAEVLTATTDNSGHAVFRELAEGNYSVVVKRDGYFAMVNDLFQPQVNVNVQIGPQSQGGARGVPLPGVIYSTTRQPVQQITVTLVQGATISGRIQDSNRRPASLISVGAYRVGYQNGHRVLNQVGNAAQSDDRGEYRLFWVPPGEYYIRTGSSARSLIASTAAGASNYPSVMYYPGTPDPRMATPIAVREATDMSGIDIALPPGSGVTISGTVVNNIGNGRVGPQGQVIRTVSSIFLVPRNALFFENPTLLPVLGGGAAAAARGGTPLSDSETRFEIRGVPPGTYDLYPVYNDGSLPAANSGIPGYSFARTPIEVGRENVTGIQSVIRPGTNVTGHLTITGNPPAAAPNRAAQPFNIANIRLQFQPRENLPSLVRLGTSAATTMGADGTFNMVNLVDGKYFISNVPGMPVDAYVSEIRLNSKSVFDEGSIDIGKETANLDVVITRGAGTLQGTVQNAKHEPVAGVRVTLIPDMPRRGNVLLYKNASSNPMGAFTMNGIAPGNYKLFAWEQNPAGAEEDPDFIRDYDLLGTPVSISAGLPLTNIQVTPLSNKH